LGGAALAAQGLNGKQKTEVEKIAKKYAGKPGPAGSNGTNGSNGAKGDTGATGANGTAGTAGTAGTNGKSVTVTTINSGGSKCESRAGAEVKQEGAGSGTAVCNGKDGTTGFTETLPSGKTETGTWTASGFASWETTNIPSSISFPIPLAEPSEEVVYLTKTETTASTTTTPPSGCKYEVSGKPVAPSGKLCVFTLLETHGDITGIETPSAVGDLVTGAFLKAQAVEFEGEIGWLEIQGVWAVSAK
jgi:hypothetical protein